MYTLTTATIMLDIRITPTINPAIMPIKLVLYEVLEPLGLVELLED